MHRVVASAGWEAGDVQVSPTRTCVTGAINQKRRLMIVFRFYVSIAVIQHRNAR